MKKVKSIILTQQEIVDICVDYIEEFYDQDISEDAECYIVYDEEDEEYLLEFVINKKEIG